MTRISHPLIMFTDLPKFWSVTSVVIDTIPVTVLHKLNLEREDPLDTTLTCAVFTAELSQEINFLAEKIQTKLERKAKHLNVEYFTPHVELGSTQIFSGIEFTILGGTYSSEETGVVVETTYVSMEILNDEEVNIIEITTVVPLPHLFTSEPEINHILDNIIVAVQ